MLLPPGSPPPPKTRAARVGPWCHLVSTWTLSVRGRAAGTQKGPSAQPGKAHLGWLASRALLGTAYLLFIPPTCSPDQPSGKSQEVPRRPSPFRPSPAPWVAAPLCSASCAQVPKPCWASLLAAPGSSPSIWQAEPGGLWHRSWHLPSEQGGELAKVSLS